MTQSFPTRRSSDLSFHPVQPHVAIDAAILRPVGLDLHMQEKMDLATKLLRHFLPRGLADLLDPRAALAEHDGALAVPCDKDLRSEEHTSELQSLMRISYAVFCLKKKKKTIK